MVTKQWLYKIRMFMKLGKKRINKRYLYRKIDNNTIMNIIMRIILLISIFLPCMLHVCKLYLLFQQDDKKRPN